MRGGGSRNSTTENKENTTIINHYFHLGICTGKIQHFLVDCFFCCCCLKAVERDFARVFALSQSINVKLIFFITFIGHTIYLSCYVI